MSALDQLLSTDLATKISFPIARVAPDDRVSLINKALRSKQSDLRRQGENWLRITLMLEPILRGVTLEES